MESTATRGTNQRMINLAVLLLAMTTLLFIPLLILKYGYLPPDDVLRHAAKAVSGKELGEILVLNDEIVMDTHPGWHVILGFWQQLTDWDTENMAVFSILILFWLFCLVPLTLFKRPEAWLTSLLAVTATLPYITSRLVLGRPLLVSMTVLLLLCHQWRNLAGQKTPLVTMTVLTAGFAAATWIHCAWYLFILPIAAFCLAREWKAARRLTTAIVIGIGFGALFTGQPLAFLFQNLAFPFRAMGTHQLQRTLVSEFRPFDGELLIFPLVTALLAWRALRGNWNRKCLDNPVFILASMSWVLGFIAGRFWFDWGVPAILFWIALELQDVCETFLPAGAKGRLMMTLAVGITLLLVTTSDIYGRWTNTLTKEYLTSGNHALKDWMPLPDGIIYSDSMTVFYDTFFKNPKAPWRYMLGYEPTMMPSGDLAIFRNIQWHYSADETFTPWIKKMRPKDRLILRRSRYNMPAMPQLEWRYAVKNTWIGRPRTNADDQTSTAEGDDQ